MTLFSVGQVWAEKITNVANIESGKQYYIGSTKSNSTDYYLQVTGRGATTGKVKGNAVTSLDDADVFTFTQTSGGWTIRFSNGKYLVLPDAKDNGKVYVQADAGDWTIANASSLLSMKYGNFYLKNNQSTTTTNFGMYASGQLDLWLEPVSSGDPDACATPTFSKATGVYNGAQNVTISCETEGAAIHYTLDGSDPTTSSPTYSSAIAVSTTTTIKALAVKSGLENSAVASATYTIVSIEHAGTESDPYTVADARNAIAVGGDLSNKYVSGIISQVDEFNSTYSSITYWIVDDLQDTSAPLQVYSGKGLNGAAFSSIDDLKVADEVTVKGTLKLYNTTYEFDKNNQLVSFNRPDATPCATPTFSPAAGTYTSAQEVSISCETSGATIYYTTDGTVPTNESSVYSSAINVGENMTIKAIAMKEGMENSFVGIAAYTINLPEDENVQKTWDLSVDSYVADPEPTEELIQWTATYVSMKNERNGSGNTAVNNYIPTTNSSTRFYKNNKVTITPNGKQITSIVFTATTQGYGTALKNSAWTNATASSSAEVVTVTPTNGKNAISAVIGGTCGFTSVQVNYEDISATAPADPMFSVDAGEYTEVQSVEISCETEGATIYYTTDGTTPSASSTEYTAVISVGESMTIKAIAIKDEESSNVAEAAYVINLPVSEEEQKTWDLTKDEMASASEDELTWTATYVDMSITSGTSTAANNYCPPAHEETRVYTGATLTISPKGKQITTIVFETNGSTPFKNATWTNGAFSNEGNTVTITASTPGNVVAVFGANTRIYSVQVNYGPIDESIPDAPTFTPAAGTYTSAQSVELACATEGATIYYTTDGTTPTSESTEYTAAISVGENKTIKAIAIKDEKVSPVATANYIINLPLSTIPAIFEAATSTQTEVNIKLGNWVVSGVGTDEKTVYVTDNTNNGFIIYNSDHGFEVGDILSGTITCDLKKYKGAAELIGVTTSTTGLTVTKGGTVTPATVAPADLAGVNTGALIALSSWKYDGSNLTNGTTDIQPYTTLYDFGETFVENNYYNVSGIYLQFDSKKEILPRNAADVEEVNLADPEISYSPATLTITDGDAWSAPTLVNPHTLAIASYVSDNEEVATVTDGGLIQLAGGHGTAVITAHTNGNSTYGAGNATYTITVNAPAPTPSGTTYRKVTATEDITDGEYLIVYEGDATHDAYAFNGSLADVDQAKKGVAVTINEDVIAGTAAIDAAIFTIDVTAGTLQSASGLYIGKETYANGLDQSETTQYVNTFAITEGEAVITGAGNCTLRYNYASDNLRFRYYKSGQQAIQLYKKEATEPQYETIRENLEPGRHYTVCLEKNVTAVKGATFWSLTYKNNENTAAYLVEETEIEAGKPYIYQATADKLEVLYGTETATNPVENGALRGTFTYMDATALGAVVGDVYMLFNNELRPIGTNNHLDAHRAYVLYNLLQPVSSTSNLAPGKKVKAMPLHKETATDIDNLNASEKPVKMVIDGQLYIIRGEKMYDATGRLVK